MIVNLYVYINKKRSYFAKMGKHYLNDRQLFKELIISRGKGKLTNKGGRMIILLCDNIWRKFHYRYINMPENGYDVYMYGLEQVLKNWKIFDYNKYDKCMPYLTEIFKRGVSLGFSHVVLKKKNWVDETQSYVRIDLFMVKKSD